MGNNSSVQLNSEIRALTHQVNAYLLSKSAILYQISQLKLKLNSRSNYGDDSGKPESLAKDSEDIPKIVESILEIGRQKAQETNEIENSYLDFSELIAEKEQLTATLESTKSEELSVLEELLNRKEELEARFEELSAKEMMFKGLTIEELKERTNALFAENEELERIIEGLKSKHAYIVERYSDTMTRKGMKRKTMLGLAIVNDKAMNLRSKLIMKEEFIKAIQQTRVEQELYFANIEIGKAKVEEDNHTEVEEQKLMLELNENRDKILEFEWEIGELAKEKERLMKVKPRSNDFSMEIAYPEKLEDEPHNEDSFGSSISSILNGFGDFKLEKKVMAEENIKLQQHITEAFGIRKRK